jgi:hypothetical protein
MVRAGAHARYVQTQMGHSSSQVTVDEYGHLIPDANREVPAALDGLVRGDGAHTVPADENDATAPNQEEPALQALL